MSVEALTWALQQQIAHGPKFVLVVLANAADKAGATYVGQETIGADCSLKVRAVGTHMATLERLGLIARVRRFRRNGSRTSDWTVLAPRAAARGAMLDASLEEYPAAVAELATTRRIDHTQILPVASFDADHPQERGGPDPLEEPPAAVGGARARATRHRVGGEEVSEEDWETAGRVLAAVSDASSSSSRFTADSWRGLIVRRRREHPELTEDDHARIVAHVAEETWWRDSGSLHPRLIYGSAEQFERCAAQALGTAPAGASEGEGSSPRGRDDGYQAVRRRRAAALRSLMGGGPAGAPTADNAAEPAA